MLFPTKSGFRMENGRRVQANGDGHLQLPEEIIQHIQHFLTAKEAAQTTVLSKLWYNSWLTRSTLDFSDCDFREEKDFVSFVNKSIFRYEESNLKIEKFCLRMKVRDILGIRFGEWIMKVAAMGVKSMYINICIKSRAGFMVLPKEVFEAKSLENLVVHGCKVGGYSEGKVMCCNLTELELHSSIVAASMIEEIFSKCTLLEKVILSSCMGLGEDVDVSKLLNLREVNFNLPNKMTPRFHDRTLGSAIGMRIFKTLTDLVMAYVTIDPAVLDGFSAMFPCIKKLSICDCYGCEVINISSKSLEAITCGGMFRIAMFDVPCIKMFKFTGANIPFLSFTQCSKKWESFISLTSWDPSATWLFELKIFLLRLGGSKISLDLFIAGTLIDIVGDLRLQNSPKPAVENLSLKYYPETVSTEVCSRIWDNLLWSFSPKFINYMQYPKSDSRRNKNEVFWEDFTHRMLNQQFIGMAEGLLLIRGLDGVYLELFEHPQSEWKPLPWVAFFDDSTIPSAGRKVRFLLRWKRCANAGLQRHSR